MTDNKFLSIIKKASADDRYYFTFFQLYSAWCKTKGKINLSNLFGIAFKYILIGSFAFAFISIKCTLPKNSFLFFLILLPMIALMHGIVHYHRPNQKDLRTLIRKWFNSKGPIKKMLVEPSMHESPPKFQEGDLYDYGVERIIIVERPILVDLLVKNDFHADQKALVFSMDGYPTYIAEKAKKLLTESPDLPVYLLHDATEKGMKMHKKIKLPGHHPVIDLGVFPEQMKNLSMLKSLRLKHQGYQAPLDALPYAALSALSVAAIAAHVPFDEVLASWKQEENSVGDSSVSNYG